MTKLAIRELTESEIAAFHADGWVLAPGLMSRELASELQGRALALMGSAAENSSGGGGGDPAFASYRNILRNYLGAWRADPLMNEIARSPILARNVSRLLRGRPVRFFNDEILVKPPQEEGGKATPWHQDFPHAPFDRCGLVNIWFSLVPLAANGGSMSFLSGSHRFGSFGRTLLEDQDVVEQNPWITRECQLVASPSMEPGDATIHGDLTVHGGAAYAGPNWRWAYLVNHMDATVRHAGGPSYGEDLGDLPANAAFPDDRFPILDPGTGCA